MRLNMNIDNIVTKEELIKLNKNAQAGIGKSITDFTKIIKLILFFLIIIFVLAVLDIVCNYSLSRLIVFELWAPFLIMIVLTIKRSIKTLNTVQSDLKICETNDISVSADENGIRDNYSNYIDYKDVTSFYVYDGYIVVNTADKPSVAVKTDMEEQRNMFHLLWKQTITFFISTKKEDNTTFKNPKINDTVVAHNKKILRKRLLVCLLTSIVLVAATVLPVEILKKNNKPIIPAVEPFEKMYEAFENSNDSQEIYDVYAGYLTDNFDAAIKSTVLENGYSMVEVFFLKGADKIYSISISDDSINSKRQIWESMFSTKEECISSLMSLEYINKTYPKTDYYYSSPFSVAVSFGLKDRYFMPSKKATYNFSQEKISFSGKINDVNGRFNIYLLKNTAAGEDAVNRYFANLKNECQKPYNQQNIDIMTITADLFAWYNN